MLPSTRPGMALVAVGLAAAAIAHAVAAPSDRFMLGVLRRDGIVTPFAAFDGKHWRNDWPKPVPHVDDVPVTVRSVPRWWWGRPGPRETWRAWLASATQVELHVTGAGAYDAQCLQQVGLRTDYHPSAPPPGPGARPYPKDGLAASPDAPIERIDVIPIPPIERPLEQAFLRAEALAAAGAPAGSLRDLVRRQGGAPPVVIEAAYAAGDLSSRIYYFEAVRRYERRTGSCEGLSYGAGWFARDGNGPLRNLSFEVTTTTCDRAGALYMLPLGAMRADGHFYWIAQWSGWNTEQYDIVEIKPKDTEDALRVFGGGCE
jgi:hypothetical protein